MSKNTKSFLLESLIVVRLSLVEKTKNQRSAPSSKQADAAMDEKRKRVSGPAGVVGIYVTFFV